MACASVCPRAGALGNASRSIFRTRSATAAGYVRSRTRAEPRHHRPMTSTYRVKVHTAIRVAMRDGVELNVRITRPDAAGRFPGVMEYHPYRRLAAPLPDWREEYP